jgi:hypothetical protein
MMTTQIKSLVSGDAVELEWADAVCDWQDPIVTNPCETPRGEQWMDAYLLQLALQEVR